MSEGLSEKLGRFLPSTDISSRCSEERLWLEVCKKINVVLERKSLGFVFGDTSAVAEHNQRREVEFSRLLREEGYVEPYVEACKQQRVLLKHYQRRLKHFGVELQ